MSTGNIMATLQLISKRRTIGWIIHHSSVGPKNTRESIIGNIRNLKYRPGDDDIDNSKPLKSVR